MSVKDDWSLSKSICGNCSHLVQRHQPTGTLWQLGKQAINNNINVFFLISGEQADLQIFFWKQSGKLQLNFILGLSFSPLFEY